MGTPYYMSPEQCRGRDISERTDIYSFGIVAYQLLTGKLPFDGQDFMEILLKQLTEQPVPPSQLVPELLPSVDRGIAWMMMKDAKKRPSNLAAGMRALEDAAAEAGVALPPSPASISAEGQSRVITPAPGSLASRPGSTPRVPSGAPSLGAIGTAPTLGVDAQDSFVAAEKSGTMARAPRRRSSLLVMAAALLLLGLGVGAYALGTAGAPARPAAGPAPPEPAPVVAPSAPVAPPAAAPAPAPEPTPVTLTIEGVPAGTEVVNPDGIVLGSAPGPIKLAREDVPVKLTLRARGFKPLTHEFVPSADATVKLTLRALAPTAPAGKRQKPAPGPKSKDRESLEDFGD